MGSQVSTNTNDKERQLKKASKMSMIRSLLPIVGLVVIFLLFNVMTDFRMMNNMSLAFSQVYVTMISAMGVFFIMTMGGLDFSQGPSFVFPPLLYVCFQNTAFHWQSSEVLHPVQPLEQLTDISM